MIQATATTTASSRDLFRHLAVPEAWGAWGRFPTRARQAREGDTSPYGVGAVKTIWPASEQTVAYDPDTHFGYVAIKGLPVRRYRADVHLEDGAQGTLIRWEATFEPLVPGTGALIGFGLRQMLRAFVRWLPAHVENCPADCPARRAKDIRPA